MLTLTSLSNKLVELSDKYAEMMPRFNMIELQYVSKKAATLMSQEIMGLGSQPLRDAECERMMSLTQEYLDYHSMKPEMDVINMQIKIFMQLSRNLSNIQWEGAR